MNQFRPPSRWTEGTAFALPFLAMLLAPTPGWADETPAPQAVLAMSEFRVPGAGLMGRYHLASQPRSNRAETILAVAAPQPEQIAPPQRGPEPAAPGVLPPMMRHFFASGLAGLSRGDAAAAAEDFEVANALAQQVPQLKYLLALSRVLADFGQRQQNLPLIRDCLAAEPAQPLYAALQVLADPGLSQLKPDGALYLAREGAQRLDAAKARLPGSKDAYNGKYLAALLDGIEPSGDAALPFRLPGFAAMLGKGRTITLPQTAYPQALGRLLVIALPQAPAAPHATRYAEGAGNPVSLR